jgi:Transposase domain (DUF772)
LEKVSRSLGLCDSVRLILTATEAGHDGAAGGRSEPAFLSFNLEERIPANHLLRRINPVGTRVLAELREKLTPFYSDIGRPSIDPELMIRMLIVGYCYGIRSERRLCEEVEMHLAYRWFCRLDLDDNVPDHSTFSVQSARPVPEQPGLPMRFLSRIHERIQSFAAKFLPNGTGNFLV